tara:strand:- start:698 stop:2443 length:1746 start_codon:yes stop_codon:yes gene_type:complete
MPSKQKNPIGKNMDDVLLEDEIDFKEIFKTLIRNKKFIAIFALLGLFYGGYKLATTKRSWQGEFQIVLEASTNQLISAMQMSSPLNTSRLAGLKGMNNQLRTQVEVLKSPSVLLKIYEFVNEKKDQNISYNYWKSNVNVILKKGTAILNVTYQDTDKELVIPVLENISTAYQEYSGRKRERGIKLGIDYFQDQIRIYKNKNKESLRLVQQYANDYDLAIPDATINLAKNDPVVGQRSGIQVDRPVLLNIESVRVEYSNQIRILNQQIKQAKELDIDSEQIRYIASNNQTLLAQGDIFNQLKQIEIVDAELVNFRVTYKESDENIQDLLVKRKLLIKELRDHLIGYLTAQKLDAQLLLDATERPDGVLLKYRELLAESTRNAQTISYLETEYRRLMLEKARIEDPWELITNPTLIPEPYSTRVIKFLSAGFFAGLLAGAGTAVLKDKIKDKLYSINEMQRITQWPLIAELPIGETASLEESLTLLINGPILDSDGSIAIIKIGQLPSSAIHEIDQYLKKYLDGRDFIITHDIREANKRSNLIVMTAAGVTKRREIIDIHKKLLIQYKNILGLIVLIDKDLIV